MNANTIAFGIEVECTLPNSDTTPIGAYHHGLQVPWLPEGWRAERDSSIHALVPGRKGCEFVSPKLQGHQGLAEVLEAVDGPEGLASIRRARPDVALVDVGLPGFDGYEVARRVRAEDKSIRLIALTGYGQPDDRRRALEAGFDAHLVKPVDFETLDEAIRAPRAEP